MLIEKVIGYMESGLEGDQSGGHNLSQVRDDSSLDLEVIGIERKTCLGDKTEWPG